MTAEGYAGAANTRLTLGKYKGQTIDEVAKTDEGLLYLDWLYGWLTEKPYGFHAPTRTALAIYFSDPAIKADVERLVNR